MSNNMVDVMLDFETLGNGKNACVTQIGACYFNRDTGEIGQTFECNVDAKSAVLSGADMDPETVYWWLSQSKEAQESMLKEPRRLIEAAFTELNDFLKCSKRIWSHATFDFVILSETLRRLRIHPAYRYTAARDIRTLIDLSGLTINKTAKRTGLHHNGLQDCIYQVEYCVAAMKAIKDVQNGQTKIASKRNAEAVNTSS